MHKVIEHLNSLTAMLVKLVIRLRRLLSQVLTICQVFITNVISQSPKLQVIIELLQRYAAIFRQAWQDRHNLNPLPLLPDEAAFLPAALALQETPISPAPRATLWLLMSFALCVLVWAIFGKIDIVATANGKLVPNDRTKVIQPMETAMVRAIYVTDGQQVHFGDVLIELDDGSANADSLRIANDLIVARLQAARAEAMLDALLQKKSPKIEVIAGMETQRIQQAQRVLEGQYTELRSKLAQLDTDMVKRRAELSSTKEIVKKLEKTVPIAQQRAKDLGILLKKDFIAKHGYLEREQVRIEQEADLATQRSRVQELMAAAQEVESQKVTLIAETRRTNLDSLSEARQKVEELEQELVKAKIRTKQMKLTAPVEGTVQQLAVHTVGGVVTPAQPLMMIVPKDNPLEVEAFVENKDIGFVNVGQEAEIKLETFPFTKFGTIHGQLTQVSNDAIDDEKRGLIYSCRVRPERVTMQVEDKTVNLTPGMAVTVEVKTGKRRVIEYFLSPLIQHTNESLRER